MSFPQIDRLCDSAEGGCIIHKHLFCDHYEDCPAGHDEINGPCKTLTNETCQRKLQMERPKNESDPPPDHPPWIPLDWVMDGVEDCKNGFDENASNWKQCGEGTLTRYIEKNNTCAEVFKCSADEFVELSQLCDGESTCDKETIVCQESRDLPKPQISAYRHHGSVYIGHHLPGLHELERFLGKSTVGLT